MSVQARRARTHTVGSVCQQKQCSRGEAFVSRENVPTLRYVRWDRRKAAQRLGVSYKMLLNKIKQTGITPRSVAVGDGASS